MRFRVMGAVCAVAAGLVTATVWSSSEAGAAPIQSAVKTAATYGTSRGYRTGIAVEDLKTGKVWTGGSARSEFPTESVVKVFIATRILLEGRMHGTTAARAYKMVTQSDDAIASSLYPTVGGADIEPWIEHHYHIADLGSRPSTFPRNWGNTKITAVGMVRFYAAVKKDKKVGPWLLNAMHHATHHGSDGFNQFFGLKVADPGAAIKQGWGDDTNDFDSTVMPSTGYVDGNRFAVALLTMHTPFNGYDHVRAISNAQARILLPGGHIQLTTTHRPTLYFPGKPTATDGVHTRGSLVRITGWAFDRDASSRALTVDAYEGSHRVASVRTTIPRPHLNSKFHISGVHGFALTFTATNGRHRYSVVAHSIGGGADVRYSSQLVKVSGNPRGHFDSARIVAKKPVLRGWAFDPDAWTGPSKVQVLEGRHSVGYWKANASRPDVNAVHNFAGRHGFVITIAHASRGTHHYTVKAVNFGSNKAASRVVLGTRTVRVP